jgi:hypothetical protein
LNITESAPSRDFSGNISLSLALPRRKGDNLSLDQRRAFSSVGWTYRKSLGSRSRLPSVNTVAMIVPPICAPLLRVTIRQGSAGLRAL